jgi:hypothetical protein
VGGCIRCALLNAFWSSIPFFLLRFLRKDPHTCKWADVGDDIAREKTSQVVRDAVQYQTG